ncbi:hypothetical protein HRI_003264700 [Hibiscus trionum]|uniref:Uncharacterized protein n=1 Tax=Hibiscus trionum TaxID=183268 RepID=A0A9W7IFP8_HIBTR|nr:hypothetical protein HRI_003264700 [Hibiscus trionum]
MSATSILKLALPSYSFKSNITKLPVSVLLTTTNSNSTKLLSPPWRRILAERSFSASREVPSGPNYTSPPLDALEIPGTTEMDPSDTPLEFTTTSDPPPLGRPTPETGPDFPKPPLGPPPTGPEVVPVPPPPSRKPPPEVDPPTPPSTPPDYVPPPSVPPEVPTPGIPPDIPPPPKGPSFVF